MAPLAMFGIKNSGINVMLTLLIMSLVVVWVALVYWTYVDARRRLDDEMLIGCAVASSLFPFVGTLIYTIVRPPEFLDDVRERDLEMQAAEARIARLAHTTCPHCHQSVDADFLRCPHCLRKLRYPCRECDRPLDPAWKICPYCESEIVPLASPPSTTPSSRRGRRRSTEPTP